MNGRWRRAIGLLRQRYRAALFACVLAASGVAGVWFHHLSNDPVLPVSSKPAPLNLTFYVKNRNQTLNIDIDVARRPDLDRQNYVATLDVIGDPASTLILASQQDKEGLFDQVTPQKYPKVDWAYVIPTDVQVGRSDPTEPRALTLFTIPATYVAHDRGTFAARLPSIASGETGRQDAPAYGVIGEQSKTIRVTRIPSGGISFSDHVSTSPFDYAIPDPKDETLYWQPKNISVTIHLSNEASQLDDARIDQDSPSNGVVQDPDVVWTGSFGVSPYIVATKYSAVNERSRYEFYSGIALGLGGAALVALVQELPAELSRRRRKDRARRRVGSASAGAKPGRRLVAENAVANNFPARQQTESLRPASQTTRRRKRNRRRK